MHRQPIDASSPPPPQSSRTHKFSERASELSEWRRDNIVTKGVGAGGSGGDDAWANGDGNGKTTVPKPPCRERENNRLRERRRRAIASRIVADGTTYRKEPKPPAGDDQQIADVDVGSGGSDPVPAWLKNLSEQLRDNSYLPRLRKKARYSSPPPATPPPSPDRASNNVLRSAWATGAGASRYSVQTSTPPLSFSEAPGEEEVILTEEEALELTQGNAQIRKDRA